MIIQCSVRNCGLKRVTRAHVRQSGQEVIGVLYTCAKHEEISFPEFTDSATGKLLTTAAIFGVEG